MMLHAFLAKIPSGSEEEEDAYFVVFAILSDDGHLGFSTWQNFTILKPCSLVMLHVNFNNTVRM